MEGTDFIPRVSSSGSKATHFSDDFLGLSIISKENNQRRFALRFIFGFLFLTESW